MNCVSSSTVYISRVPRQLVLPVITSVLPGHPQHRGPCCGRTKHRSLVCFQQHDPLQHGNPSAIHTLAHLAWADSTTKARCANAATTGGDRHPQPSTLLTDMHVQIGTCTALCCPRCRSGPAGSPVGCGPQRSAGSRCPRLAGPPAWLQVRGVPSRAHAGGQRAHSCCLLQAEVSCSAAQAGCKPQLVKLQLLKE